MSYVGEKETQSSLFHYDLVSWQKGHRYQYLLQARKRHQGEEPERIEILYLQLDTRQFTCVIKLNTRNSKQF